MIKICTVNNNTRYEVTKSTPSAALAASGASPVSFSAVPRSSLLPQQTSSAAPDAGGVDWLAWKQPPSQL